MGSEPIIRELIETGTISPSKRDSLKGSRIPVSLARAIIEQALGSPETQKGKRFGAVGLLLQSLPDGSIEFSQTYECTLGGMKEDKQLFSSLGQAIDAFLKAREKDFPRIPFRIHLDWNA